MIGKKDVLLASLVGFLVAIFFLSVAANLGIDVWFLPVVLLMFPVLSVLGIIIAAKIAGTIPTLLQAAKFLLIGALNTFIDIGVLNFLIAFTGAASGLSYSVFKGLSFLTAVVNSYAWNKYWTFSAKNISKNAWKEFVQFFVVSAFGFAINVGTASIVVNAIGPRFGFSQELWANVGAIIAAFNSFVWNFLGYKLIVFADNGKPRTV
ncbi:MAG: GtrA family protein [Parcubacteria group bacterium]|nr:GtrA family protein [Parcubacteria group bacterium]